MEMFVKDTMCICQIIRLIQKPGRNWKITLLQILVRFHSDKCHQKGIKSSIAWFPVLFVVCNNDEASEDMLSCELKRL